MIASPNRTSHGENLEKSSFPGSAWERTASAALPRVSEISDAIVPDRQEPVGQCVPRQSLGTRRVRLVPVGWAESSKPTNRFGTIIRFHLIRCPTRDSASTPFGGLRRLSPPYILIGAFRHPVSLSASSIRGAACRAALRSLAPVAFPSSRNPHRRSI